MSNIRKDKYCLKGEYYEAFENANNRLGFFVPRSFRKEISSDLLELFFRNQNLGKSLNDVLGKNIDVFINELIETYYLTLGKGKLINYKLQNAFSYSIICMTFYIINSNFNSYHEILPYSFAAIFMGWIGFIGGLLKSYVAYKYIYKFTSYKKNLFQILLSIGPILFVLFADKLIYNATKNIMVTKNLIDGLIMVEITIYLLLVLLFKYKEKREQNGR